MSKQLYFICDYCNKEKVQQEARNWIDVTTPSETHITSKDEYPMPNLYGLYCSENCLSQRITERENFDISTVKGAKYYDGKWYITGTFNSIGKALPLF